MNYTERIASDHRVMLGKPVIKGTRITVELIIKKLSEGATVEDVLSMYNHLKRDDIMAALAYAADLLAGEETIAKAS